MPEDDKENHQPNLVLKQKASDEECKTSPKRQRIAHSQSPEKAYYHKIRSEFAIRKCEQRIITSPEARDIYRRHDSGDFFDRKIEFKDGLEFKGKFVLQADRLFDPTAMVLNSLGQWETNLERMMRGLSPIGHKGIVSETERSSLSFEEIRIKQERERVDLQHVTQDNSGTEENPICEMTHPAHMGLNARMILELDSKTQTASIVASNLEKQEALALCQPHQIIKTNLLHFRKGRSIVKDERPAFSEWRKKYWQFRAQQISNGNFSRTHSPKKTKVKIFRSPKRLCL